MNRRPLKPCSYPSCPKLTRDRYCDDHVLTRTTAPRSSSKMGYDRKWRKYRAHYLTNYPLCVACMKKGIYTPATVVDHIVPHKGDKRLFYDDNNLQSMCDSCHGVKTASEDMGWWDTTKGLQ